ncbi:ATP-binding protein [candidate division CSSED10-310 bacterium]|uniref:histidine kinase n=1 Tax=candidate division CSSED10-310 bacterium TaxID=2855610 RepID=A0ABV6YRZ5_UNCC1
MKQLLSESKHTFPAFLRFRHLVLVSSLLFFITIGSAIYLIHQNAGTMSKGNVLPEVVLIAGMFIFGLITLVYHYFMSKALKERVKQTEANLHETEQVYERIVEQATDLIYILDLDLRVVLLNRHSAEVFSHLLIKNHDKTTLAEDNLSPIDAFVGHRMDELIKSRDADFVRKHIDIMLNHQSSHSYSHSFMIKERKVYFNTKLFPIRDDEGHIDLVLGISRDVTKKHEGEQRMYHMEKLASIGVLAAGVAHEINNPLAVILGFTELLQEKCDRESAQYEDLKAIELNANHAKKVVENMLGFARITEGLEDIIDIRQSISIVIKIIEHTLTTHQIELVSNISARLARVWGDVREFQQVIFNIINNSVAAMKERGGTLTISATMNQDRVEIRITDTGIGIPARIRPHIFDPFFTTKKVGEGTGLGLSLCYGIIKKCNGTITFKSDSPLDNPALTQGQTTFTISMPAYRSDEKGEGENI